jgi:hydrogenase maturation factor
MVITGAAGTEYITYKGVVNQITLTNTKATSKVGDYVKIGGAISGTTWTVLDIQGVWA